MAGLPSMRKSHTGHQAGNFRATLNSTLVLQVVHSDNMGANSFNNFNTFYVRKLRYAVLCSLFHPSNYGQHWSQLFTPITFFFFYNPDIRKNNKLVWLGAWQPRQSFLDKRVVTVRHWCKLVFLLSSTCCGLNFLVLHLARSARSKTSFF